MKYVFIVSALALLLSGCGGASSPPAAPTPPGSLYACFGPAVPTFTLVSPAPGASGVAVTTTELTFSGTLDTTSPPAVKVTAPSGSSYQTSVITPNGSGTYSVALPALHAHTTYTVYYVVPTGESSPCNDLTLDEGSFTTQ